MKKKKALITISVVLLIICLIPYPIRYLDDGGTVIYNAVLYKVIKWHMINPDYDFDSVDSNGKHTGSEPHYLIGTDIYIFPFNFGDKEYGDRERPQK